MGKNGGQIRAKEVKYLARFKDESKTISESALAHSTVTGFILSCPLVVKKLHQNS